MTDNWDDEPEIHSGVAWYRRDQWPLLKSASADAEDLEETYDEWLEYAERHFKDIWDAGINLHKVDVDVEDLIGWCREQNRPLDGSARAAYVIKKFNKK
jgi:hypothetical protein